MGPIDFPTKTDIIILLAIIVVISVCAWEFGGWLLSFIDIDINFTF